MRVINTPKEVELSRLEQWSAFERRIWRSKPITKAEVKEALDKDRLEPKSFQTWTKESRRRHIERVAYLVRHPNLEPIDIDVGIPVLRYAPDWPITDGNHRLAAAFYRGDKTIKADISGQIDYIEELLGVKYVEAQVPDLEASR